MRAGIVVGNANVPFELNRFKNACESFYARVVLALEGGRKQGNWVRYFFDRMYGLGRIGTARRIAIRSTEEARAYLAHPVLDNRLMECA